jgi:hypothetical protein
LENCSDALLAVVTLPPPPWGLHKKYDSHQEVDKKFFLGKGEMEKRGSRGCSPWDASPMGERGGHPQNLIKNGELQDFYTAGFF